MTSYRFCRFSSRPTETTTGSRSGIVVKGVDDVAVRFSKCCSPVPGDEIVGFVTRGRGVSIHRKDCVNIINLPEEERGRLIEAGWAANNDEGTGTYLADIKVYANNRTGLLVDILKGKCLLRDEIFEEFRQRGCSSR